MAKHKVKTAHHKDKEHEMHEKGGKKEHHMKESAHKKHHKK